MSRCKTVKFFYDLVPLKPWRGLLIRRHIEKCPRCLAGLASREEAGSLLVQEGANIADFLWTEVEKALLAESGGEHVKDRTIRPVVMRPRGWAVAAILLLIFIAGFLLFKDFRSDDVSSAAAVPARFELEYVRVGGQPANTVVYQPQGSDMIIVWAGKSP